MRCQNQKTVNHCFFQINKWIDDIARRISYVDSIELGKTFEGRSQKLVRIAKAGPGKPHILIQAGAHAREWISISTCLYLINELTKPNSTDPDVAHFLNNLNFHIIPVVNPDGYEYSAAFQRMWRKTRSNNAGSTCKGVDPNRNWNHKWGCEQSCSLVCHIIVILTLNRVRNQLQSLL